MVDGCCRKGSRNALQELYNPTQVGGQRACITALSLCISLSISLGPHLFLFVLFSSPSCQRSDLTKSSEALTPAGFRLAFFVYACLCASLFLAFLVFFLASQTWIVA